MSEVWFADRSVADHAREAGEATAIIDGHARLTWAALDAGASAIAARIREAGVGPGARVALAAGVSGDAIAALLGILRAGAVAAPIPAGLTHREVAAALDVLGPSLVLRDEDLAGVATPGHASVVGELDRDPEAIALVVLTSGTTGRPKGVLLSSRALAASADAWLAVLPPATAWAMPLGIGHVAGLGILWRAIRQRVPVSLVPPADPGAFLAALRGDPAPSHASLVAAQLRRVLDAIGDAPPPPTLRAVPLGGGAIPASLVLRALAAGWPVVPTYGLSEMGSGVTALPAAEASEAPGTAGRPLPGVTLAIRDPGPDGVGEILVDGPSRCSGYVGEPVVEAPGPLETGDLGRLDDAGRLVVLDRRTDRIVRGGENVSPAEVEAVVVAHPAIREVAVVGRPDATWGQVPVAAVVLADPAADPGDAALAAHARGSLAGFKVPDAFVRLAALPRTPGGKLRREAVRALLAGEPVGELARPDGDAIGWRLTGAGPRHILLLPGTLSTAAQLGGLATALAALGDVTVHAIDRRGSGSGRLAEPRPLDVAVHVADVVAYLDARGLARAAIVGVSFGGVLALETGARHPDRVEAIVAWEPPYGALGDGDARAWFGRVAADTAAAHRTGGAAAAAETFMRAVAGDQGWERLSPRARAFLEREGDGALADAGLTGLDPDGLARIEAPVAILTGGASDPFYVPIADELARRIRRARRDALPDLAHPAPITDPASVAMAIRACLELPT